ncbi:MAG TPA: hypothetical protein VMW76_08855 [Bacteroidales bacterium]|nr:hypothetical protein [Bacteroidales bacterium]
MDIKYINVSYMEEVCGGDNELITEMINIFRQQVVEFSEEFNRLYNNQDYFNLGLLAHKAKSSIAIMGMEELAMDLKELELKASTGEDTELYSKYLSEFELQTTFALEELDWYLKNLE